MSQFCIYLTVPPYLKEYLNFHFGDPVVFSSALPMNKVIKLYIARPPKGKEVEFPDDDQIAVAIPDQPRKPAEYFNYLSDSAKQALLESIQHTFDVNLYNDIVLSLSNGVKLMTSIRAWCESHGISIDSDNTIKQKFYRVRDALAKQGIELMRETKIKKE